MTKTLDTIEADHAGQLAALNTKHDMEVASLKRQLQEAEDSKVRSL